MASKILLVYLLSSFALAVSTASVYEPRSYPEDDEAAEVFLKRFRRIIDTKNRELISTLFGNQFSFRGCDEQYTKTDLVDAIMNSTADNTQFRIVQVGTKRVEGLIVIFAQFGFAKSLSDFKQSSFAVKMLYQKETNMLIGIIMYEEECKFPRNPLIANKPDLGERYMQEFNTVLLERSSELELWLEDGFTFNSCNEMIGKDEFIKRMTRPTAKVVIVFHSATEVGADSLKFDVTAYGFEQEPVKIQFVLNLENRRFTYGIAQSCKQIVPKQNPTQVTRQPVPTVQTQPRPTVQSQPGSTVQPQPSSPPVIASQSNAADFANKVMNEAQNVINNQDKNATKVLFDSEFILNTCTKNLTLDKAVEFLFEPKKSFNFKIHGADELVDNKIKFITTVNSVKNITVEMTIRKSDGVFLGGKMLKCGDYEVAEEKARDQAIKMLAQFTEEVKTGDVNKIKAMFTDNFELTTCKKKTVTRDDMAGEFSKINKADDVKFELKKVKDTNPKVILIVSVTSVATTKEMQFELNKENDKIEKMNDCPALFV